MIWSVRLGLIDGISFDLLAFDGPALDEKCSNGGRPRCAFVPHFADLSALVFVSIVGIFVIVGAMLSQMFKFWLCCRDLLLFLHSSEENEGPKLQGKSPVKSRARKLPELGTALRDLTELGHGLEKSSCQS